MPGGGRRFSGSHSAPGTHSGGTSLEETGGGFGVWVAAVGVLAVAGGVALFLMRGNGSEKPAAESAKPAPVTTGPAPVTRPAELAAPDPAEPDETPPEAAERADDKRFMAVTLGRGLDARRLWATVEFEAATLVISSAYCAEAGMREELTAQAAELSKAGFSLVRCHERHGPQVFELAVSELSAAAPAPGGAE